MAKPKATPKTTPPATTLRLCWEVVAAHQSRGLHPLIALRNALRRDDVVQALTRLQRPGQQLRVAAVTPLVQFSGGADDSDVRELALSLREAARALASVDVAFDVWPQIDDDDRFLNTRTARSYSERLLPVLKTLRDLLQEAEAGVDVGLFLDMEPPLQTLQGAWRLTNGAPVLTKARGLGNLLSGVAGALWEARQGSRDLTELAKDLAAFSFPITTAVPPPVLPLDVFGADAIKRWVLGCPDDDVDGAALFGRTAALCYAPMLRRKGIDRAAQHRALNLWAARHRERSDAICLGPISTGLLGDEPVYVAAEHLRADLTGVRALGFTDVTLYSGEGLLFGPAGDPEAPLRPDVDAWIEAVVGAPIAARLAAAG
ncbi:MAG: hypothetical protein Q8O67_13525 [Deltaproteobacteria bacterium]|nr:hypothetical protein [Deltaproteobacteria bacterium]